MEDKNKTTPASNKVTLCKEFNEELRARLDEYKKRHNVSLANLATELGSNVASVSNYIAKKPEGNIAKFEERVMDILDTEAKRDQSHYKFFSTQATRTIEAHLEKVRRTNDMALLYGPAGVGKTVGGKLYQIKNPSSIYIFVPQWNRGPSQLINAIWTSTSTQGWNKYERRADYIARKFTGSNRLFIIDNAQRLTSDGLTYFFDFHDTTGCPIAFLANPELFERIKDNDQFFSRIGTKKHISLNDAEHIAENMITQMLNGNYHTVAGLEPKLQPLPQLMDLAVQVLEQHGHARALYKQLKLTKEIRENTQKDYRECFRAAHTQLIREYKLQLNKGEGDE